VNPGGDAGWDGPPLDIQVPDDARELERDILAYHRERRAIKRRRRLRRIMPAEAGIMPLIASILAVCLVAGMMLSVFTISPTDGPVKTPVTRPPTPASQPARAGQGAGAGQSAGAGQPAQASQSAGTSQTAGSTRTAGSTQTARGSTQTARPSPRVPGAQRSSAAPRERAAG
jgi:hypothetical protein